MLSNLGAQSHDSRAMAHGESEVRTLGVGAKFQRSMKGVKFQLSSRSWHITCNLESVESGEPVSVSMHEKAPKRNPRLPVTAISAGEFSLKPIDTDNKYRKDHAPQTAELGSCGLYG